MEPEGSLPHLQVPATCPYPEPDESSTPTHFFKIHLNIYPPIYAWVFQVVFPLGFPIKTPYAPFLSHMHATCSAHLIPFNLITRTILGRE